MGSYHLNSPNAAGEPQVSLTMTQPVADAPPAETQVSEALQAGPTEAEWACFAAWISRSTRLDCEKIEQMKAMLGVRSTVDVIRHALRAYCSSWPAKRRKATRLSSCTRTSVSRFSINDDLRRGICRSG